MYSYTLLTTSVRGNGEEPTTPASSVEGCNGFIRAGFGFLAAFVPAWSCFVWTALDIDMEGSVVTPS
jgi:hypothetical protein